MSLDPVRLSVLGSARTCTYSSAPLFFKVRTRIPAPLTRRLGSGGIATRGIAVRGALAHTSFTALEFGDHNSGYLGDFGVPARMLSARLDGER